VWTWQEAILPPKVLFCVEQAGTYRYDPFDREFLKDLFPYKSTELSSHGRVNVMDVDWKRSIALTLVFSSLHCILGVRGNRVYGIMLELWSNPIERAPTKKILSMV
jgi:hypothetical protein